MCQACQTIFYQVTVIATARMPCSGARPAPGTHHGPSAASHWREAWNLLEWSRSKTSKTSKNFHLTIAASSLVYLWRVSGEVKWVWSQCHYVQSDVAWFICVCVCVWNFKAIHVYSCIVDVFSCLSWVHGLWQSCTKSVSAAAKSIDGTGFVAESMNHLQMDSAIIASICKHFKLKVGLFLVDKPSMKCQSQAQNNWLSNQLSN